MADTTPRAAAPRVPILAGLGTRAAAFTPADRTGPMRSLPGPGGRLPLGPIAAGPDRLGLAALDLVAPPPPSA